MGMRKLNNLITGGDNHETQVLLNDVKPLPSLALPNLVNFRTSRIHARSEENSETQEKLRKEIENLSSNTYKNNSVASGNKNGNENLHIEDDSERPKQVAKKTKTIHEPISNEFEVTYSDKSSTPLNTASINLQSKTKLAEQPKKHKNKHGKVLIVNRAKLMSQNKASDIRKMKPSKMDYLIKRVKPLVKTENLVKMEENGCLLDSNINENGDKTVSSIKTAILTCKCGKFPGMKWKVGQKRKRRCKQCENCLIPTCNECKYCTKSYWAKQGKHCIKAKPCLKAVVPNCACFEIAAVGVV